MAQNSKNRTAAAAAFLIGRIILRIAIYIAVIFLLVTAGKTAYSFGYSVFTSRAMTPAPGKSVAVTIGAEMTDKEISELLESKGLIEDGTVFLIQAKIYDYKIYPGTYILNTSQTVSEMMEIMSTQPETEEDGTVIPTKASGKES